MLRNYLKTTLRNILRNRTFSLINTFGLSVSLAICLIIIMMVGDQMSMDRHLENADNIYRINTQRLHEESAFNILATSPLPLAEELTENYTGIRNYTRIRRGFGNNWIGIENDHTIPLGGFFTDQSFIELFELELVYGNPATALTEPNTVIITEEASKKLFGNNNPLGEVIDMDNIGEYKVTGVIKDNGTKSHIIYEALASMASTEKLELDTLLSKANNNWDATTSGWIYIDIDPNKSIDEVLSHLEEIDAKIYAEKELVDYRFLLQHILDINPGPLIGNQIGPGLPMLFVYFLGGLALIIILCACFNYTNMSIAKSLSRAKEVGIRKVSGAVKNQIFIQFIMESIFVTLISLAFAFILVILIEPAFKSLAMASMLKWELSFHWSVILISILFAIGVGLIAGILPSIVLSSFQPIKVLKDLSNMKLLSKMGLRKVLLTIQLTLSLFFIITVIILQKQLDLMVSADKGFDVENVINIPLIRTDGEALKNELSRQSAIQGVTLASHIPASGTTYGDFFRRTMDAERFDLSYFVVDENYTDLMDLKLTAGRFINKEANKSNETEIVINQRAVVQFGFTDQHDALGKVVYNQDSAEVVVVGVVEDYNHQAMLQEIGPMALRMLPDGFNLAHVKISANNQEQAIQQIEEAWAKVNPTKQIQHKYLDDEIGQFYEMTFGDLTKIVSTFSFLALSIAGLGLFGMAIYTTQTRMKEISIRKVLGASSQSVVMLVSKGFLQLLGIAVLLALPLSFFVNKLWLDSIAYRVDISPAILISGTLILLAVGVGTIGSQTLKAGWTNPASNLKNE